ncbi:MAG: glycosyltransferase [Henriciella sp.]|nr:glycosyltransferase [Henriciella sp.]
MAPLFSIITVSYKHAWALTKTARSVFRQRDADFEYLIVDGASNDGTRELTEFWKEQKLVDRSIHAPDSGVYQAMNNGIDLATGEFICFLNAGDVFAEDLVLNQAAKILENRDKDGCLGWGALNDNVWASWHAGEAFKLSSLGFCHQALFVKRSLLLDCKFDERSHKTDSDTLQLGRLFANDAQIELCPEVWAIRAGDPGISADLVRTKKSIVDTLQSEYAFDKGDIEEKIVEFRRKCTHVSDMLQLLRNSRGREQKHLALMILDTLFQRQSKSLSPAIVQNLRDAAITALGDKAETEVANLLSAQTRRASEVSKSRQAQEALRQDIKEFAAQEQRRFDRILPMTSAPSGTQYSIGLTSFPKRISTLGFVLRSLKEQSQQADTINLFLGRDEIPNENWLPSSVRELKQHGLQIHFVEKTCHQYDKFVHLPASLREKCYIIVDDDVIYPPHSMQKLLEAHQQHPEAIIGNRCHKIAVDDDKNIGPYRTWEREARTNAPSYILMPTGAGGVLYPPGFFNHPCIRDERTILRNAPYADDVWLKFNALLQERPTMATELSSGSDWYHRYTPTMREGTLMAENVDLGLNDMQIRQCESWLAKHRPDWRDLLSLEQ